MTTSAPSDGATHEAAIATNGILNGPGRNEDMAARMLASSEKHKAIMMMAARDLKSRGLVAALPGTAVAAAERGRPPSRQPPHRVSPRERYSTRSWRWHRPPSAQREHAPASARIHRHRGRDGTTLPAPHATASRDVEGKAEREMLGTEIAAAGLRGREEGRGGNATAA